MVAATSTRTRTPARLAAEIGLAARFAALTTDGRHHEPMLTAVLDVVADRLPAEGTLLAGGPTAKRLPVDAGRLRTDVVIGRTDIGDLPAHAYAGAALLDDELALAGAHAEELVDALGSALEPGAVLAVTVPNRVHASLTGRVLDGLRAWSADEAAAMINHRGFAIELLCAPGAGAGVRGERGFDVNIDRRPGLLDAAERLLIIARAPADEHERSVVFHDSRPRKIAAAATICRDDRDRVLVVYDRFKRAWTIPGGVVDADEDPAAAAARETWEEGGVDTDVGALLGVFASRWPDRLVFVFAARPVTMVNDPRPIHTHEIGAVEWLPLDQALDRVTSTVAFKIRRCLDDPGHTWIQ